MADDLIIKFFREDLTEAEEKALSDRLLSSTEDALRFGHHAEASYRHYDLPEPKWRGGGPPPGFLPKSAFKLGPWLLTGLVAGLLAWAVWNYWKGTERKMAASVPPAFSNPVQSPVAAKSNPPAVQPKEAVIPEKLVLLGAPPSPALTPMKMGDPTHHPHTNLEVLVNQKKLGAITVRVMGPDGSQAVMIYQGTLQPGGWTFDWNGRLSNGGAPPAGTYQIQVVSGAVTLNKSVVIRK